MQKLTGREPNWSVAAKLAGYPLCTECQEPLTLEMQAAKWTRHTGCNGFKQYPHEGNPPRDGFHFQVRLTIGGSKIDKRVVNVLATGVINGYPATKPRNCTSSKLHKIVKSNSITLVALTTLE